jgi:hypothetical protein
MFSRSLKTLYRRLLQLFHPIIMASPLPQIALGQTDLWAGGLVKLLQAVVDLLEVVADHFEGALHAALGDASDFQFIHPLAPFQEGVGALDGRPPAGVLSPYLFAGEIFPDLGSHDGVLNRSSRVSQTLAGGENDEKSTDNWR